MTTPIVTFLIIVLHTVFHLNVSGNRGTLVPMANNQSQQPQIIQTQYPYQYANQIDPRRFTMYAQSYEWERVIFDLSLFEK